MKNILILLLFCTLISCSPQQRLERLLKHHPELVRHDSDTVKAPVIIPAKTVDNNAAKLRDFIRGLQRGDTVVVEKEKIITKVYTDHDTVHIKVFVPADTVLKEIRVPVERLVPTEVTVHTIPWWIWLLVAFLAAVILGLVFRKKA